MKQFFPLFDNVPDDPFYQPRKPLWLPREMSEPPILPRQPRRRPQPRTALLINPFYAKSPHGSFGKHVLTPTLALTSLAGATPAQISARPAYVAGCYLSKRSNRLWKFLIKHQLVHAVWRPFVDLTRLRHLAFRNQLEKSATSKSPAMCGTPIPASV